MNQQLTQPELGQNKDDSTLPFPYMKLTYSTMLLHSIPMAELPSFQILKGDFECFSNLPPELRNMIWKMTLPGPRVVGLRCTKMVCDDFDGFTSSAELPLILSVNHEARKVAEKAYPLSFGDSTNNKRVRFDFSIDTLYISDSALTEISQVSRLLEIGDIQGVKRLAMSQTFLDKYIEPMPQLQPLSVFQNLEMFALFKFKDTRHHFVQDGGRRVKLWMHTDIKAEAKHHEIKQRLGLLGIDHAQAFKASVEVFIEVKRRTMTMKYSGTPREAVVDAGKKAAIPEKTNVQATIGSSSEKVERKRQGSNRDDGKATVADAREKLKEIKKTTIVPEKWLESRLILSHYPRYHELESLEKEATNQRE